MVCLQHDQKKLLYFIGIIIGSIVLLFMVREIFSWMCKTQNIYDRLSNIEASIDKLNSVMS